MAEPLAAFALAAGRGERLRPLTDLRPKVLLPVDGVPLLDLALQRLGDAVGQGTCPTAQVAVNAHYLADQVVRAVGERAHLSVERGEALGTAGALGLLRGWVAGRPVLVTNADVYQPDGLAGLLPGWDGERCRLLVRPVVAGERVDFRDGDGTGVRYLGSCLLPWSAVRGLAAVPSGLYEVLWRDLAEQGRLDLVPFSGTSMDCGTPGDYLAANLLASGGQSVVAPDAQVLGRLERCVVWGGAWVGPDEHLRDVVRAGTRQQPVTVGPGAATPAGAPTAP